MRNPHRRRQWSAANSLTQLLAANPEIGVDENFSGRKERAPANRDLKRLTAEALEIGFDTLWLQAGGPPDFWRKVHIPGWPGYEAEYELDRYNADYQVAVEIQGGQHLEISGHSSPKGLGRDARKLARCNEERIFLWHLPTDMVTLEWVGVILRFVKAMEQVIQ